MASCCLRPLSEVRECRKAQGEPASLFAPLPSLWVQPLCKGLFLLPGIKYPEQ